MSTQNEMEPMNMKTVEKTLLILLFCVFTSTFAARSLQAQVQFGSYLSRISAANKLSKFNAIDTNNIDLIKRIADSSKHWLNMEALLFLAQHGDRSVLARVESRYYEGIQKSYPEYSLNALSALIALQGQNAYPYAVGLLDSMLAQNQEQRGRYSSDDLVQVIEVHLDYGDLSRYGLFKSLFSGIGRPHAQYLNDFYWFVQLDPSKEDDAFAAVKSFLNESDRGYRLEALKTLNWFRNQPSRFQLLKQVALSDTSVEVRETAADYLKSDDRIEDAIEVYENLVASGIDTLCYNSALYALDDINSPFAFAAMKRLKGTVGSPTALYHLSTTLATYEPARPASSASVSEMVDALGSFIPQCASLDWLGDQSFVTQLGQFVDQAKLSLVTTTDSLQCAQKIKQLQQVLDREYQDSSNATQAFVTVEGWRFLHYNAQYVLDRLPSTPVGLVVKLISSSSSSLTGGSAQYYEGSWKDAVNNNDGTFNVNTTLTTVSLRMTYAYGSQTKSNVSVGGGPVTFQTVSTQVKLQNSQGALMDQGTVQYYAGAWRDFGSTTNGVATMELLPANYSFRMTYAFASKDIQQNIGTNPTVVFNTVAANVQLLNSLGNPIDQGTVQYYAGAWRSFGTTTNGVATKELLPNNYSFRMIYEYVSNDKQQDIGANSTVSFSTLLCTVRVSNMLGQMLSGAMVSYYSGAWRQIGSTVNGMLTKELLPATLSFRMSYAGKSQDKQQTLSTNPVVEFVAQ
jgi:hypothetical protein